MVAGTSKSESASRRGSSNNHAKLYSLDINNESVPVEKVLTKVDLNDDLKTVVVVEEAKAEECDKKESPPDGGCLAWSIAFASFMISFILDGIGHSFGLLLPAVSAHFNTGRTEAAMTNGILTLVLYGSGPLVAFLVIRVGHRTITITGVVLATLGLLIAGLSIEYLDPPSLIVFYITVGVMTGLGFGFMYLAAMDIIELYFDKNLGLASGIASAGSGIGQLVMAPLIHLVDDQLGLAYTMILLAGAVAFGIFFAFLYSKPGSVEPKAPVLEEISNLISIKADDEHEVELSMTLKVEDTTTEGCSLLKSYGKIFTSPAMAVMLAYHFLVSIAIFAAFSFTADRATQIGIDKTSTSHLLSIMGICNCIGRILFGKVLDIFRSRAFSLTTLVLIVNAGIVAASDFMPGFLGQAVYAGVFGATYGAYTSSGFVLLKMISQDEVTDSMGVLFLVKAVASLVGPAIVGLFYDISQSYRAGFLVVGGLGVAGALLLPAVQTLHKQKSPIKAVKNSNL